MRCAVFLVLSGCGLVTINGKPLGDGGGGGGTVAGGGSVEAPPLPSGVSFPDPPPRDGDTAGCPSQQVLGRRTRDQNDANGGGYGYYRVGYDASTGRRPIVSISEASWNEWIDEAIARLGDSPEMLLDGQDDDLALAWGTYCAYWQDGYIHDGLERLRAAYLEHTPIDPELERTMHLAAVDQVATAAEVEATCAVERDAPVSGLVAGVACRDHDNHLGPSVYQHREHGDDGPLVSGAFVWLCSQLLAIPDKGDLDYVGYRYCARERDAADAAAIDAALENADVAPWARLRFRAAWQLGVAHLDDAAARVAKHEKAAPADKKLVDAVLAEADEVWAPRYEKWMRVLDALDKWHGEVAGNSDEAAGCEDRFSKLLAKYVGEVAPSAKGLALVEAAQDPIGYHLVLALAVCRVATDDVPRGQATARLVRDEGGWGFGSDHGKYVDFRRRVDTVQSFHDQVEAMMTTAIHASKGKLSSWMRLYHLGSNLDLRERKADRLGYNFGSGSNDHYEVVAKVGKHGDQVELTFKKKSIAAYDLDSCAPWIDERGNSHARTNCKTVKIDATEAPLRLPRDEGALVKKGDLVLFVAPAGKQDAGHQDKTPRDGRLTAIQRGKNVIWLLGI